MKLPLPIRIPGSHADAQYKGMVAMQAIARAGAELVQHGKLNEVQAIMRDSESTISWG